MLGLGIYLGWTKANRLGVVSNPPSVVTPAQLPGSTAAGESDSASLAPASPTLPPVAAGLPPSPAAEGRDQPSTVPLAPLAPPERAAFEPQQIIFRHNAVDGNRGLLAAVDYPALGQRQFIGGLSCETLHFASGRGIYLTAQCGVFTTYNAVIFDSTFKRLFTIPLKGRRVGAGFRRTDDWLR